MSRLLPATGLTALPLAGVLLIALGLSSCDSRLEVRSNQQLLLVDSVNPPQESGGVNPGAAITVTFSRPLDHSQSSPTPVSLRPVDCGPPIDGDTSADPTDARRLIFRPALPLETPGVRYRIQIDPQIFSVDGRALDLRRSTLVWEFTTVDLDLSPVDFEGVLRAEAVSDRSVRVGWSAAADAATPAGEISYRVYAANTRADLLIGPPAMVTSPGATEALVTGLEPLTTYFFLVRAVDRACREDPNTATISARTLAEPDTVPPTFAGARSAAATSPTSISVDWDPATDNRDASSDLRFRVYLAEASGGFNFSAPLLTTEAGAVAAEITGLTPDRLHFVVVRALDTSDNEDRNTREVSARTPPDLVSFATDVLPVLKVTCALISCHGVAPRSPLDLRTYQGLMNPAINAVRSGNAAGSLIIWRTDSRNPNFRIADRMPPEPRLPLSTDFLDDFIRWIDQGALNN